MCLQDFSCGILVAAEGSSKRVQVSGVVDAEWMGDGDTPSPQRTAEPSFH